MAHLDLPFGSVGTRKSLKILTEESGGAILNQPLPESIPAKT
jgi:hypothetical protein